MRAANAEEGLWRAGVRSGGSCGRRPARKWAAAGDGGEENVYFIRRVSVIIGAKRSQRRMDFHHFQ